MVPIFAFFSLCIGAGILQLLFPRVYSAVANAASGIAMGVTGATNFTKKFLGYVVLYASLTLVTWFGLIVLAIHYRSWVFAIAGFVSIMGTFLVSAILLKAMNAVAMTALIHIHAIATRWSSLIKLQTLAWHALTPWMKFIHLLLTPFYGLYFMLARPTQGLLELVRVVASFGLSFQPRIQLIVRIMGAVSVVSGTLVCVIMFQMEYGLSIMSLPALGLGLMFVAMLISLLIMSGSAMMDVWDFLQAFGYIGLLLIILTGYGVAFPDLSHSLAGKIFSRWIAVSTNVANNEWLAMLLIMAMFLLASRAPWLRNFAGPLAIFLFGIWIFGTDYNSRFYVQWQWWATTVGLLVGLLFMWPMKNPPPLQVHVTPAPSGTAPTTPAHPPATPAPAAHPTPGAHGSAHGGHGGGDSLSPTAIFGTIAVIAILGLLTWIGFRVSRPVQVIAAPASVVVAAPAAPIPVSSSLPTPPPSVTPTGTNTWDAVLPANLEYHTGIQVSAGQTVVFSGWTGSVKLDPKEGFTNPPSGGYSTESVKLTFPEPWTKPEAWTGALLATVGTQGYADVGNRVGNSFQATQDGELVLSINCLAGERNNASGSFHGSLEVK